MAKCFMVFHKQTCLPEIQQIFDFSVPPLLHFCLFNQFIQINESFLSSDERLILYLNKYWIREYLNHFYNAFLVP